MKKLPLAVRERAAQVRHWKDKHAAIREALLDGWSTFWVAKEFAIPPCSVREIRRGLGL